MDFFFSLSLSLNLKGFMLILCFQSASNSPLCDENRLLASHFGVNFFTIQRGFTSF